MKDRFSPISGLCLSAFFIMLGTGAIVALLPQKIMDYTNSAASTGYLAMVFAAPFILLQVPFGLLSDRIGLKRFIVPGYLICGLAGVSYCFAPSAALIFLSRFIQGIGEAPIWALAPALLSLAYPENKGKAIGFYSAALHLGLTLGPLLGIVIAKFQPAVDPFFLYISLCFFGALIVFFTKSAPRPVKIRAWSKIEFKALCGKIMKRETLPVLAGIALQGAGYGVFVTIAPAFLISAKSFEAASTGVYFSLLYLSMSLSQVISGPLSDRSGRRKFMICGLIAASLSISALPMFGRPTVYFCLVSAGFGLGMFYAASISHLNDLTPDHMKGGISGIYYLIWGAGFSLAPILVGIIGDLAGYFVAFQLLAGFFALDALTMIFIVLKRGTSPAGS